MDNKLDILTKKLYEEGVDKAKQEAEEIIRKANEEAAKIIAEANNKARVAKADAEKEVENLKKKADSEMALSARQALTLLKQSITNLLAGDVAQSMAKSGFEDKAFVQDILVSIIRKWDAASGNLDLDLILAPDEKVQFETFVASKYKDLLDKGLKVKVGDTPGEFVIQPHDGGYQIAFSEELFKAFFEQYMKSFTKTLLFK